MIEWSRVTKIRAISQVTQGAMYRGHPARVLTSFLKAAGGSLGRVRVPRVKARG